MPDTAVREVPRRSDPTPKRGLVATVRRRRRTRNLIAAFGATVLVAVVLLTVIGPLVIKTDPNAQILANRLLPPLSEVDGTRYFLGTDSLGRDMLARVLHGGRASMSVVVIALVLGAVIGVVLGVIAGFYGGITDTIVSRLVDAQLALPSLIAAMFIAAFLGTGLLNTAIVLGVTSWPPYARLMRAEVLKIRSADYIEAATVLGSTDRAIFWRHIRPNITSSFAVVASLELGHIILAESSLSFLGFGMQPPNASWGSMIHDGQAYITAAWWLSAVPGVGIVLTVLGLNIVGDWLRDVFDPRAG